MSKHIVSFSGGIGSYVAAKRVVEAHGTENTVLVFTDTKGEHPDLYSFIDSAAKVLGVPLIKISDGRGIWEVFEDKKYAGNSRVAHCSTTLKSDVFAKWLDAEGGECPTIYLGIDWTESHRLETHRKHVTHKVEAPLCEEPYLSKKDMLKIVEDDGLPIPLLYQLGFSHNNCHGACVKAGQGQWAKVLKHFPEKYKESEIAQERLFETLGKRHPFLRVTRNKKLFYYSLKEFRMGVETGVLNIDKFDIGGCGCFLEA